MICTPAIIYVVFGIIEILVDLHKGLNNTAFVRFVVVILFTALLNLLCSSGLETITWIIVLFPFLFTGLTVAIILFHLGLESATGMSRQYQSNIQPPREYLFTSKYYDTYFA
jgi:cobalamin synthase